MSDTATIETPPPIPPVVPAAVRRTPARVLGLTGAAILICAAIFTLPAPGRSSPAAAPSSSGSPASLRGTAVAPAPAPTAAASVPPPAAPTAPAPSTVVAAPATATIVVAGIAARTRVLIDGQVHAARKITVPAGRHVLGVVEAGAVRRTESVLVRSGETYTWSPGITAVPTPSAAPQRTTSSPKSTAPTCRGMMEGERWEAAVIVCTKEAGAGKASAQRDLGELFERGRGVSRNESEAAMWYTKAGDGGDRDAMLRIAMAYERGRGVKKDGSTALGWYTRAANAGLADAQFTVGQAYERGKLGVRKDKATALEWYRRAAAQGHQDAIARMKGLSR